MMNNLFLLKNVHFTSKNRTNFDNLNKQQKANNRPITTNISKLRR